MDTVQTLPLLPLFRGVVFPHTTITLPVGRGPTWILMGPMSL